MNQISVSSEDLFAYSKQVDSYKNEIRTVFKEIQAKMYYIESIWQSPASKSFMQQFQSLNPAMISYLNTLDRFARFLSQTASLYQDNEESLSKSYKR